MKKILVVEDEIAYSKLLSAHLTKKGYAVMSAIDGAKGLAIAQSEKPDLILLDIRMPVMDGLTMLSKLRKDKELKKTKVIILTNLEPDDKIISAVVTGQPSYYCVKSDTKFDAMIEKIEEVLTI